MSKEQSESAAKQKQASEKSEPGETRLISVEIKTPVPIGVKNEPYERHPKLQAAKTWAEIIGIGAAIFYAFVAVLQWCAMRDSNTINREALESVQRAFISLSVIQEDRFSSPKGGHFWDIMPKIENSGTTPAVGVINYARADLLPAEPDEKTFIGDAKRFTGVSIGPKAIQGLAILRQQESYIFGKDLDDLKHVTLDSRQTAFYVWGWIAYRDVFKKPHLTEFCGDLQSLRVSLDGKTIGWNMGNCSRHNCTDEYCEDYKQLMDFIDHVRQLGYCR